MGKHEAFAEFVVPLDAEGRVGVLTLPTPVRERDMRAVKHFCDHMTAIVVDEAAQSPVAARTGEATPNE